MRTGLTVSVVVCMASAAYAQVYIGGAQSLHIQPSARSAGMADCTMAVLDDASSSSWNPGGLAFMQQRVSISATFSRLVPDWEDVHYIYGAAACRVAPSIAVATSLTYLSYGTQVVTDPDSPEPIGTFNPYEMIPSLACAAAIGDHIGVGVNLKYVYVDLAPAEFTQDQQKREGSTIGADVGAEYRTTLSTGRLAVLLRGAGSVANLGGRIEYEDEQQADRLPVKARTGGSVQLSWGRVGHILACGQYERSLVDGWDSGESGIWGVGLELEMSLLGVAAEATERTEIPVRDFLTGRVGYYDDKNGEVDGVSYGYGAGLDVHDSLELRFDLANVPQAEWLTRPWRIGGSGWVAFSL
jgi:hypothetical protein